MAEGIRYVRNGGVAIPYQVVGEGDVDLVSVADYVSNLVYDWEFPPGYVGMHPRLRERARMSPTTSEGGEVAGDKVGWPT